MSVSDEQALLQAVWAEPDDDAPRLVYADWLEENGQPERAEFIRVQCELTRSRLALAQRQRLRAREDQLWTTHRHEWLGVLRDSPLPWRFHRGFLQRLGKTGFFRAEIRFANSIQPSLWSKTRFYATGVVLHEENHDPLGSEIWRPVNGRRYTGHYRLEWKGSAQINVQIQFTAVPNTIFAEGTIIASEMNMTLRGGSTPPGLGFCLPHEWVFCLPDDCVE